MVGKDQVLGYACYRPGVCRVPGRLEAITDLQKQHSIWAINVPPQLTYNFCFAVSAQCKGNNATLAETLPLQGYDPQKLRPRFPRGRQQPTERSVGLGIRRPRQICPALSAPHANNCRQWIEENVCILCLFYITQLQQKSQQEWC